MPEHVLITQKLLESCEEALCARYTAHRLYQQADPAAFLAEYGDSIRAIAGFSVSASMIDALPRLGIISTPTVGYDAIDVAAARARNVRVTTTPGVLNDAVAEMTLGLMIALARRIPEADRFVRDGKWLAGGFPLQRELTGRTVGIIGLGRIGREIASRCQAMKMRVVYHGRNEQPNTPFLYYPRLVDMARDVDWLIAITPGGKSTERIINREVLEALGPKGFLVNMSRGSVVDQPVLIEMLGNGGLAGAALDVFADEPNVPAALRALDNVVLSPHQASATHQTRRAMGALVVANIDAYFAGEPLLTPVV